MTYREQVEQFINQFNITHSVSANIEFKYCFNRTDQYDDLFKKDIKIFIHQLNRRFYGRKVSKTDYNEELPIVIPCIENRNSKFEPLHFHFAIGNLPIHRFSKEEIEEKIKKSWYATRFHEKRKSKSIVVKEVFCKKGWTNYITKELKFKNESCVLYDLIQTSKLVN